MQGGGLLGVHAGSPPLVRGRELGPGADPPLEVLLEAELPEPVVMMMVVPPARTERKTLTLASHRVSEPEGRAVLCSYGTLMDVMEP